MDSPAWHASSALASHLLTLRASRAAAARAPTHARPRLSPDQDAVRDADAELVSRPLLQLTLALDIDNAGYACAARLLPPRHGSRFRRCPAIERAVVLLAAVCGEADSQVVRRGTRAAGV